MLTCLSFFNGGGQPSLSPISSNRPALRKLSPSSSLPVVSLLPGFQRVKLEVCEVMCDLTGSGLLKLSSWRELPVERGGWTEGEDFNFFKFLPLSP